MEGKMRVTILLLAFIAKVYSNPKYPDICGLENKPSAEGKVIGGQEAARNQFPWLVALLSGGYCTASVLDENWIITAKHCVSPGSPAWIKAGVHNRFDASIEPHMQEYEVSEIYVSPLGDFALLKLPKPLVFNEYVRPVCLPTRADIENTFVGANATLTGWGVNSFDHKANYPELYFYKSTPIIPCGWADETILCTSTDQGASICFGDSGGPLNIEIGDGKYMQIGVNQFVANSKCVGGVNGYARLTTHLDFIQETTGIVFE